MYITSKYPEAFRHIQFSPEEWDREPFLSDGDTESGVFTLGRDSLPASPTQVGTFTLGMDPLPASPTDVGTSGTSGTSGEPAVTECPAASLAAEEVAEPTLATAGVPEPSITLVAIQSSLEIFGEEPVLPGQVGVASEEATVTGSPRSGFAAEGDNPPATPSPQCGYPALAARAGNPEADTGALEFITALPCAGVIFADVETTGLTPYSKPVKVPRRVVADASLRLRVVTLGFFDGEDFRTAAFDLDALSETAALSLVDAVLRQRMLVGHNLTFDLGWLRHRWSLGHPGEPVPQPEYAFDTMLWVRLLRPETSVETGGFRLADLLAESAGETLDKQFQKPVNWVPPTLSPESLDYARRDVTALRDWLEITLPGVSRLDGRLLDVARAPVETLTRELPGMFQPDDAETLNELVETWLQTPNMLSSLFLRGQPFSSAAVHEYVASQTGHIETAAAALVALEPLLEPYHLALGNPNAGTPAALHTALADAFTRRGLRLGRTKKTDRPQIGVKDLRASGATRNPETLLLYTPWKTINDAKRRVKMALEYARFAETDGRIHPNFSPAAATARLTCSEPNMQQVPGDKAFRAFVRGNGESRIIACDVSALDVRVGAALAVRTQRLLRENPGRALEAMLRENYPGSDFNEFLRASHSQFGRIQELWDAAKQSGWSSCRQETPPHPLWALLSAQEALEAAMDGAQSSILERLAAIQEANSTEEHRFSLIEARAVLEEDREFRPYGPEYVEARDALLRMRLENAFHQIFRLEEADGAYSSLRQAFRMGVDIHSWTAARLKGWDAAARFAGCRHPEEYAEANEALKAELGKTRNLGKVANLALMYGMGTDGFLHYCKATWDMHFIEDDETHLDAAAQRELALSRARELRLQWLEAYPEIQLFSAVTEMQGRFYPRMSNWQTESGRKILRQGPRWFTRTLTGRPVYAASRFAAMNYPNQGTGSDILLMTKYRLHRDNPEVFGCLVNQVHDELVLETPGDKAPEHARILEGTLLACGESLLSPYGVPMKAETVIAEVWTKG